MADADYSGKAVQAVLHGKMAYCKFLAANDTGETGGHQSGIYVSKPAVPSECWIVAVSDKPTQAMDPIK